MSPWCEQPLAVPAPVPGHQLALQDPRSGAQMHQHRTLQRLFHEWEAVPKVPLLVGLQVVFSAHGSAPILGGGHMAQDTVLELLML